MVLTSNDVAARSKPFILDTPRNDYPEKLYKRGDNRAITPPIYHEKEGPVTLIRLNRHRIT
jgi:hypothetical protein